MKKQDKKKIEQLSTLTKATTSTFTDDQINELCVQLDKGVDQLLAARSIGIDGELFYVVMERAKKNKFDPNRKHYDQINQRGAQVEVEFVDKWANNKDGGIAAADFLKATRPKYNAKVAALMDFNLRAVCMLIKELDCDHCRTTLLAKVSAFGSSDEFLDDSDVRMMK